MTRIGASDPLPIRRPLRRADASLIRDCNWRLPTSYDRSHQTICTEVYAIEFPSADQVGPIP